MMSVKGGTQTWTTAPQQSSQKPDNTNSISASDREKYFQDESIGDTLNKVADPNYIDESKKMRTVGDPTLGKDAFMTLLLTQMKNQDPTNPLKSHEMAAQLAQFTQLEKLQNIDSGIAGLRKDAEPNKNFEALAFIGKTITTDNSKVSRTDTESQHEIRFNLPADAQTMKMVVKDAAGNPVRNLEFKNLKSGKNELNWNGMTDDGSKAPAGEYSVAFEAMGSNGHKMAIETKTEGVISGVNFTPKGPQLMVGKQVVNMSDVKSIAESSPTDMSTLAVPNQGKMFPVSNEGPKKAEVKPEHKPDAAKRAKLSKGDLNDAAMAQGLINSLNKTGAKAGMG
jgi:flagellar basal-body rod modification protein FlgD